jgi:VWFA-related protein
MNLPIRLLAWLLAIAATVCGQQTFEPGEMRASSGAYRPRRQFIVRVDTKLVEVGVVVRDSHGRAVPGLTRNDFEISDEGKKREISNFVVETSAPPAVEPGTGQRPAAAPQRVSQRYVGLLFDDISMGPRELPQAQMAARRFVKEGVKPDDHIAIFTTSGAQNLEFTTDIDKLLEAVGKLHLNNRTPSGGMCPNMTPYDAYLIANRIDIGAFNAKISETARCQSQPTPADVTSFEGTVMRSTGRGRSAPAPPPQIIQQVKAQANGIWEQVRMMSQNTLGTIADVVDYMARMPENRILLMASAGFLSGTLEQEMDEITRRALHVGVVINALDAKGLYADEMLEATGGADARSLTRMLTMGNVAKEAGNDALASLAYNTGGLFFHNNNDLNLGFHELGMRPEVSYLLGFSPVEAPDGKYHKLKVRLTAGGHNSVQARQGYMAIAPAPAQAPPERRIDIVALDTGPLQEIPGGITAEGVRLDSGEPALQTVFHVDVKGLRFKEEAGVRHQTLSLIAMVLDASGNFVTAKEGTIDLALKEATFERLTQNGWNLSLTLPVAAGDYRLRAVLGEGMDGKVSAWTEEVQVR